MTLDIAMQCSNGIVIGADSMGSHGIEGATTTVKTRTCNSPASAVAFAGNGGLCNIFGDLIVNYLANNKPPGQNPNWQQNLSIKLQKKLVNFGKISIPIGHTKPICDFCCFVGHEYNNKAVLTLYDESLIACGFGKQFYMAIGSGFKQANPLLKHFTDEYRLNINNLPDVGLGGYIVYRTLKTAIAASSAYIGYPIRIIIMEEVGSGVTLKEHYLESEFYVNSRDIDPVINDYEHQIENMRNKIITNHYEYYPEKSINIPNIER